MDAETVVEDRAKAVENGGAMTRGRHVQFDPGRSRMGVSPSYSRFVGMMKLLLPLLALGLVIAVVTMGCLVPGR